MFSPNKAEEIAKRMLAKLKRRKTKDGTKAADVSDMLASKMRGAARA